MAENFYQQYGLKAGRRVHMLSGRMGDSVKNTMKSGEVVAFYSGIVSTQASLVENDRAHTILRPLRRPLLFSIMLLFFFLASYSIALHIQNVSKSR